MRICFVRPLVLLAGVAAIFLAGLTPVSHAASALPPPLTVKVGGYNFPPFVDGAEGVTLDLLAAMNAAQSRYRFIFAPTSSRRRYADLEQDVFSLIFFENKSWGWDPAMVDESRVFLRGDGEVYVALAKPGRDQQFFADPTRHTLIGVLGYNYGFANFEADPVELQKRYRITFADNSAAMLRMLLNERAEIAVVTRAYLQGVLLAQPELRQKLLVSTRFDQAYNHTFLVRKGSEVSVKQIEEILATLERSGALRKLWRKHGIAP